MSFFSCNCGSRPGCTGWALIAAAIVGVLTAFLQVSGVIAIGAALTGVFFAIAVAFLAVITVAAALARRAGGCCRSLRAVLAGILGTIGFAVVLLVVDVSGVISALLTGALLFFFTLLLAATACYAGCLCENAE